MWTHVLSARNPRTLPCHRFLVGEIVDQDSVGIVSPGGPPLVATQPLSLALARLRLWVSLVRLICSAEAFRAVAFQIVAPLEHVRDRGACNRLSRGTGWFGECRTSVSALTADAKTARV